MGRANDRQRWEEHDDEATERSLGELYADDPERADTLAFGRKTSASRRGFLGGAGLAAMGAAVGGAIPFASGGSAGLVPAALAQSGAAPCGPRRFDHPGQARIQA